MIILKDISTGTSNRGKYACGLDHLDRPVKGLSPNFQYYYQVTATKPVHDSRTHKLIKSEIWTTDVWNDISHIFEYQIGWTVEQLSIEQIASNLKDAYVQFRDEQYPYHARLADNDQRIRILALKAAAQPYDTDEETRQWTIGAWQLLVKGEYESQRDALLDEESSVLPSFIFTPFSV